MKTTILKTIVPLCLLAMLTGCEKGPSFEGIGVGDRMPEFSVTMDNGNVANDSFLSEGCSLIVFFNTGCDDCVHELDVIQRFYDDYGDVVKFALISREEGESSVRRHWKSKGYSMPYSAQSGRRVFEMFAPHSLPRVYMFINGRVFASYDDKNMATYEDLAFIGEYWKMYQNLQFMFAKRNNEFIASWWFNLDVDVKRKLFTLSNPVEIEKLWKGYSDSEKKELYSFWINNRKSFEGLVGVLQNRLLHFVRRPFTVTVMEKKFVKEFKVYEACSDAEFSPNLWYVYFTGGYAYASDSRILVRVPLSIMTTGIDDDELRRLDGKCIHHKALKMLYKYEDIEITEEYIKVMLGRHEIKVSLIKNGDGVTMPDFEKTFDEDIERTPIKELGLSSKFLSRLASAMGEDAVKLSFTTANSKIFITDASDISSAEGIIMPTLITPTLEGF